MERGVDNEHWLLGNGRANQHSPPTPAKHPKQKLAPSPHGATPYFYNDQPPRAVFDWEAQAGIRTLQVYLNRRPGTSRERQREQMKLTFNILPTTY